MILLAGMSLTMACETEQRIFNGPYFVRFTEPTLTQKETYRQVIEIEVHNTGAAPTGDVTINYSIGGTAREGIDYRILGTRGKVRIKSGEYFGIIELQLINNANNILRSQDVILTLQTIDNNDSKLRIGQDVSQIGKTFTLTIQDDCILGGSYYGLATPTSVPVEDIVITSFNCEDYTLSNWDIDIFQFAEPRDLTFIDNGDNTLTIPPQPESTLGNLEMDGSGVVNPTTGVISFTIRFVVEEEEYEFTFDLIPD